MSPAELLLAAPSDPLCSLLLQGLNFEKDWKLLTILMGMNDICDYCKDKVSRSAERLFNEHVGGLSAFSPQTLFSVDNFIHYMTVSLEMLMNEVKKKEKKVESITRV